MLNINEIALGKIISCSTRQMSSIYTLPNEPEFRKFGPKSILRFQCDVSIDFDKHNSAIYNNLYLYGLDTIEEQDMTNKNIKTITLLIDSVTILGNEHNTYINNKRGDYSWQWTQ